MGPTIRVRARSVSDGNAHPSECERWCADRQGNSRSLPAPSCGGAGCCPPSGQAPALLFTCPEKRRSLNAAPAPRTPEGLFRSTRTVVVNVWELPTAPRRCPQLCRTPGVRRPQRACEELAEWTRRPASHAPALCLPRAAAVFAGSSRGLPETRQDMLWALGTELPGACDRSPCFLDTWSAPMAQKTVSYLGFLSSESLLGGPSPDEHHGVWARSPSRRVVPSPHQDFRGDPQAPGRGGLGPSF